MDIQKLADELKASGQISDLVELLCENAAPAMCHMEGPFGNVYCRPMEFPEVGSKHDGHYHNFDHVSYVVRGPVLVKFFKIDTNGQPITAAADKIVQAGGKVLVRADWWHQFISLAPNAYVECVFAHRDENGKQVFEFNGIMESYG